MGGRCWETRCPALRCPEIHPGSPHSGKTMMHGGFSGTPGPPLGVARAVTSPGGAVCDLPAARTPGTRAGPRPAQPPGATRMTQAPPGTCTYALPGTPPAQHSAHTGGALSHADSNPHCRPRARPTRPPDRAPQALHVTHTRGTVQSPSPGDGGETGQSPFRLHPTLHQLPLSHGSRRGAQPTHEERVHEPVGTCRCAQDLAVSSCPVWTACPSLVAEHWARPRGQQGPTHEPRTSGPRGAPALGHLPPQGSCPLTGDAQLCALEASPDLKAAGLSCALGPRRSCGTHGRGQLVLSQQLVQLRRAQGGERGPQARPAHLRQEALLVKGLGAHPMQGGQLCLPGSPQG